MMNYFHVILFYIACCCLGLTQQRSYVDQSFLDRKANAADYILDKPLDIFSTRLLSTISRTKGTNVVVSPYSIFSILSMILLGSPDSSNTFRELSHSLAISRRNLTNYVLNFLYLTNRYDGASRGQNDLSGADVKVANVIYLNHMFRIKKTYQSILHHFFASDVKRMNFGDNTAAANEINEYVADKTNNLIKDLFSHDAFNHLTRIVMVNAVYFKSSWKFPFEQYSTLDLEFHVDDRRTVTVPTMQQTHSFATYMDHSLGAEIIELPYATLSPMRMLIFLPNKGMNVFELESKMDKSLDMNRISRNLLDVVDEIRLYLPKFKAEFSTSLIEPLRAMGINDLFDQNRADLSNITNGHVYVSSAIHKAKLSLDEAGSEAAAATGISITTRGGSFSHRTIRVDRPFVFMIQDQKYGVPLFMGRIVDPSGVHSIDVPFVRKQRTMTTAPSSW